MKILLLLFFFFGSSFALFLWTILYSGQTRDTIKKALADSPVYTQISDQFASKDELVMQQDDYPVYVSKRFTPEYFRNKTETVLDDSAAWIVGRSQTVPVVSFGELKEDMLKDQPDLISAIEQIPTEAQLAATGMTAAEIDQYLNQAKQLQSFSNNDFTVQLSQYLESVKTVYNGLKIALPVLIIILIFCLVMIWLMTESTHRKFKWVGITLLISSIGGFGLIFLHHFNKDAITKLNLADETNFITFVTPLITTVLNHYVSIYLSHQAVLSTIFFIIGTCLLIAAFLTRHQAPLTLKPLKVKPSYWKASKK